MNRYSSLILCSILITFFSACNSSSIKAIQHKGSLKYENTNIDTEVLCIDRLLINPKTKQYYLQVALGQYEQLDSFSINNGIVTVHIAAESITNGSIHYKSGHYIHRVLLPLGKIDSGTVDKLNIIIKKGKKITRKANISTSSANQTIAFIQCQ